MPNQRPAFTRRLNNIQVTVWANQSGGQVFYSTEIKRRFKEGDKWREVNTFTGLGDLALVQEAVQLARDFIRQAHQSQNETAASESSSQDQQ